MAALQLKSLLCWVFAERTILSIAAMMTIMLIDITDRRAIFWFLAICKDTRGS
jgi:hypothetical protein